MYELTNRHTNKWIDIMEGGIKWKVDKWRHLHHNHKQIGKDQDGYKIWMERQTHKQTDRCTNETNGNTNSIREDRWARAYT